jgi:hypothetical protein
VNLRVDGDLIVDLVPQSHAQASVPSSLGTHSTEHRPHTARSQEASRLDEVEKLSSPYLMLADVLEALARCSTSVKFVLSYEWKRIISG